MKTDRAVTAAARGAAFSSIDPATGEAVWTGPSATAEDVADAFDAAKLAFRAWAKTPLETRIAVVRAFAKAIEARAAALAETISRETGKALWDSKGEVQAVIGKVEISIRAQAERAGRRDEAQAFGTLRLDHRPHGAMAVFGPFNFPAHLPNGHIVPALLAGNTVVFKPSELAPATAELMAEAWAEAGLPPGVLNLVQGGRDTGAAVLANPGLAGVLFTGSATTGTYIHKLFAGRPEVILALEMGGNNPLIVWPPADAGAVANLVAHSAFATSGQRCSCARRLIVPRGAWGDDIVAAIADLAAKIEPGAWNAEPAPFMGPLVSRAAGERAEAFVRDLEALGARALTPFRRDGAFVSPHVLDMEGVEAVPDEELFGPVLQIWRAGSLDEAIARANDTRFGLSGGLLCDDPAVFDRVAAELRAGVLNWNRPTTGASSALPFGGPGLSGSGRPSAYYAADYCAYPVASQASEKAAPIPAPGLPG